MSTDLELQTDPSLETLMALAIDGAIAGLCVGCPAKVLAFNPELNHCDVEPLIQQVINEGGELRAVSLPILQQVPIKYQSGGGWRFTFPLAVGDVVWLSFGDRALDAYLTTGLKLTPGDTRKHHLNDATAYPGFRHFKNPIPGVGLTDLKIGKEDGSVELVLRGDGTLALGSGSASLGVARKTDSTRVDATSDPAFVQWAAAVHGVLVALAGMGPVLAPALPAALAALGAAYQGLIASPPSTVTGTIVAASEQVVSA